SSPRTSSQTWSVNVMRPSSSAHKSRPRTRMVRSSEEEIAEARCCCEPIFMRAGLLSRISYSEMLFVLRISCDQLRHAVKCALTACYSFRIAKWSACMKSRTARPARRETMGGLAKGLDVIRAFNRDAAALTLSEVAARARLPAATARRCLLTLAELGYVMQVGRTFLLRPKVLELGAAYLDSMNIEALTKTYLEDLAS